VKVVVVRGFGYKITHYAEVPEDLLVQMCWPGPEHPFTGIVKPVAALCEQQVRSVQDVAVVMKEGTPVRCRACRMVRKYRAT
jgi:hypothetical protein